MEEDVEFLPDYGWALHKKSRIAHQGNPAISALRNFRSIKTRGFPSLFFNRFGFFYIF
jgi:hypothetical protein